MLEGGDEDPIERGLTPADGRSHGLRHVVIDAMRDLLILLREDNHRLISFPPPLRARCVFVACSCRAPALTLPG
jgi:hypothetical protein